MRRGHRSATNGRQETAPRVFRVESAQPYGWIVYLEGIAETHHFVGRALALMYTREWAKANAPSVIQVVGLGGHVEFERTYRLGEHPKYRPLGHLRAARVGRLAARR